MSPSPPFSSPLSLSYTSSARPGIIGEHRGPNIQQPHPQHASESANGEYLLHLLQAGGQLLPFQQRHSNATGNGGGEEFERQQRTSHYGFGVPGIHGIAPSGDHRSMPTWDPAVAALDPSHLHNQSGMAGCGGLAGDERNYLPGFYSSSQFNHMSPIPSGWPTPPPFPSLLPPPPPPRQQQHNRPRNPFAPTPSLGESSSSSHPSPVGFRLLQGRPGGHMFVPVPGALPSVLYGSHVDMPLRRPVEWHPTLQQPQHQHQQLEGATAERSIPPTLPVTVHAPGSVPAEGVPHQQFFGNGAELMKLLQISSSKDASGVAIDPISVDRQTGTGGINSNAAPKMNSPVVHGPIGPPKRNESSGASTISYPADDILGRFWPAPTPSTSNGGKGHNTNSTVLTDEESSMNLGAQDRCRRGEPSPGDGMADIGVGGKSISYPSTFGDRDGRAPRFTPSSRFLNSKGRGGGAGGGGGEVTPENVEFPGRKELLGGWGVEFLEDVGRASGNQEYHKIRGRAGAGREELFVKAVEQQTGKLVFHQEPLLRPLGPSSKDSVESQFLRDSSCRVDVGARGGAVGPRRIPHAGSRAEIGGRRTGRASGGQWVVVKERQREREGLETGGLSSDGGAENGSEKGSNSTGNSCKEEMMAFPKEGGVFQKAKDDTRRRRGQQQEWRMKTPNHTQMQGQTSCTFLKFSEFPADLESQEQIDGGVSSPRKIRPLAAQVDYPGLPANVLRDSLLQPGSATEVAKRSFHELASEHIENEEGERKEDEYEKGESLVGCMEMVMDEQEVGLRQIGFAPAQEGVECQIQLEQLLEFRRHRQRPMSISSLKPETNYRPDLDKFTDQMLALYLSLIPTEEEDVRRREFLSHLDQLVSREWQGAMLFLFGSCANAFGVCNSDIDVCLSVNDFQLTKADLVLKMAAILRAENMQNVQALTHARVPIVKFTDPSTGISGDICVNNMLAVVNSKLLHDYSQIDVRLRQLAFLVKHWAKRRQVNETYRGTLSSYAYVLMCIHFLQQRKPPILPCLQEMPSTYSVTLGSIDCAYFDQVETLQNFGFGNKESLGELLTSFFEYWAFGHDYNRAVISVRTGGYLSKDEKEWTRRIGNERHLICIEDPLETVHDLGRVVDRHSIRVLRDEFCRAAKILRHDLDPCTSLFDPYVRERP